MSTSPTENEMQQPSLSVHGTGYHGWALWMRQTLAILQLELVKNFWGRRALLLYLIAALPVALVSMLSLLPPDADEMRELGRLSQVFAAIYGGLILRTLIFFGCAWVFMNLFRGEVVDRSLHYYFLSPVRREVLVVGKYLSGLIATIILFGSATAASMLILFYGLLPAEASAYFLSGIGARHLLTYVGVTILACIGYGAVFLIVGLFFRNPIVPALLLYGWEWLNFLLPPGLKKISVIHYLHSLVPVPLSEGPFAVLAEPTPAYLAVPSLFIFTGVIIFLAGLHIRRMEISYAGE
ncbi:MAG: hypothetical protein PSX80_17400 [bacterium]|nr:hypothetical protein [bacterium]